jgi:hypothetical protein
MVTQQYLHQLFEYSNGKLLWKVKKSSKTKIENLRVATIKQNGHNRRKQVNNTSGYKGVYLHKSTRKWVAYCDGNSLGYYKTPEEANEVVTRHRKTIHKEFAKN